MFSNKNQKNKQKDELENEPAVSELRRDLVSGTWVVIATGRAKRPNDFKKEKRKIIKENPRKCPFCNLASPEEVNDALIYKKSNGDWSLRVIPNKFPAFVHSDDLNEREEGPYNLMDGIGFHEIIITRDHYRQIAQFNVQETAEVIDAYQERYLALMNKKFINYISIFHNHGKEAGASVVHPHSQLIAMPVIDPDIARSLLGSANYCRSNRQCVHCEMIEWEMEEKKRIIFENEDFIVFCPFVPRCAFETRVYPKKHKSYFERINNEEKMNFAEALQIALAKIYNGLKDPSYNFFIHTSPCDGRSYDHYHWHLEILPKTSIWAGFELGTGIEISTIRPEDAAEYLRSVKI
jgi:UDPglucose--hexose-1-phosphate uridylyltransferase